MGFAYHPDLLAYATASNDYKKQDSWVSSKMEQVLMVLLGILLRIINSISPAKVMCVSVCVQLSKRCKINRVVSVLADVVKALTNSSGRSAVRNRLNRMPLERLQRVLHAD